jgi:hypothetical protein
MNEPQLRALTVDELVAVDSYKSAASGALEAADKLADKIVTASFSFATAYGAVIALVAPKDSTQPLIVVLPFALLGIAVGLALYAQSMAVGIQEGAQLAALRTSVSSVVDQKRSWGRGALAVLTVGLLVAGYVLHEKYAEPAEDDSAAVVQIWLTAAGTSYVADACGNEGVAQVDGVVEKVDTLSASRVPLIVDATACPDGAGTLFLPQRAIAVAKR